MTDERLVPTLEWTPIGQTSNQLILYHPPSHALQVTPHPELFDNVPGPSTQTFLLPYRSETPVDRTERPICPECHQPLPISPPLRPRDLPDIESELRAGPSYFRILERAHEGSRPASPTPSRRFRSPTPADSVHELEAEDVPAKGYYERFFREEGRLGIGAEGSVYLATHVIGGNVLGTYAVKKIAVGSSKEYLERMLREVRLLETLRHPNIIPYHHAWIDVTRFSSFGPPITALHVLMMYATAGNLDTFLLTRSHSNQPARPDLSAGDIADGESIGQLPKEERIKAFKKRRQSGIVHKAAETRGVLLLGLEEVRKLFGDVVAGLAFLHENSILHLDLKCSNVLLHWEEGKLIPKAMISDFGTSEEMLRGKRERTGHTGTMEYMAPETLRVDAMGRWRPSDSHADMWSLGMILHKLLFLHLPYADTEDFDDLKAEILAYPGFIPSPELVESCERRHIPRDLLLLLSRLVNLVPESRPSADKVKSGLKGLRPAVGRSSRNSLISRFAQPFVNSGANEQQRLETVDSTPTTAEVEEWRRRYPSPVRPILALPSPQDEVAPVQSPRSGTKRPSDRLTLEALRFSLLLVKLLSLQPQISGIALPRIMTIPLIVLSLADLKLPIRLVSASTALHFALFMAVWRRM